MEAGAGEISNAATEHTTFCIVGQESIAADVKSSYEHETRRPQRGDRERDVQTSNSEIFNTPSTRNNEMLMMGYRLVKSVLEGLGSCDGLCCEDQPKYT